MITRLITLAAVAACALNLSAASSTRIYATIAITNAPSSGHTLVVNGSTRTWYSTVTNGAVEILRTNTIAGARTNLFSQLVAYPFAGPTVTYYGSSTNDVVIVAPVDTALTVTAATNWCTITYSTNTVYKAYTVSLPFSAETNTLRTNLMDWLSGSLSIYATTGIVSGSPIASQLVGLTNSQSVSGQKMFTGVNIHSNVGWIAFPSGSSVLNTNGIVFRKNAASVSTNTHYVLTGDSFGWPTIHDSGDTVVTGLPDDLGGILTMGMANAYFPLLTDSAHLNQWSSSNQFNGVQITNLNALSATLANPVLTNAVNRGIAIQSYATLPSTFAAGTNSSAGAAGAVAIGDSALADGTGSIAIGYQSVTDLVTNATAIGYLASAQNDNSTALGAGATTTTANQVRLGTASDSVSIPGLITSPITTNATLRGTSDLTDLGLTANTHTTLANGNNAGVVLTNSFTRVTGPTGAFTINGLAGGRSGRLAVIYNTTSQNMTIANDSGVDPVSTNRIYTLTGADVTTTGTAAATFLYDPTAQRWILVAIRD